MRNLLVLTVVLCLAMTGVLYAAPVDIPGICQGLEGELIKSEELGLGFSIGSEMDYVSEREMETNNAEAEFVAWSGKLILTISEKFDFYTNLGQATDIEYSYNILGSNVTYELEDEFMWGIGLNALIYEWEDYGVKLFADGKYRSMDDIDYENVIVDGVSYSKSQLAGTSMSAEFEEWQFALGVAKQLEQFMPYFGVKYSDIDVSGRAVIGGTTYDLGSNEADNVFGIFLGCAIKPIEEAAFSIDLQGRFIDETAFSVKGVYRF